MDLSGVYILFLLIISSQNIKLKLSGGNLLGNHMVPLLICIMMGLSVFWISSEYINC